MDITEEAVGMILERDHVSMAELSSIEGFCGGNLCHIVAQKDNLRVILWGGLTQAGADAVSALRSDPRVVMEPCDPLVYLVDGMSMRLPVLTPAMINARRKHQKDTWLPVVFRRTGRA